MQQSKLLGFLCGTLVVPLVACQKADTSSIPMLAVSAARALDAPQPSKAASLPASAPAALYIGRDSAPTEPAPPGACQLALKVLDNCAHQRKCDAEMTLYLPSAPRSNLISLSKSPWFGAAAFASYCEAVCNAKSADVNEAKFADEVCGASLPQKIKSGNSKAAMRNAMRMQVAFGDEFVVADQPVPLKKVLQRLGKPAKVTKSTFECSSAFESENTMEYTFADAGFEVSGQEAVLRWARLGPKARLVLPSDAGAAMPVTREVLASLPGYPRLALKADAIRIGLKPGTDLSRAFDFQFVDGRVAKVELWIGC
jgi:hypothetical protein